MNGIGLLPTRSLRLGALASLRLIRLLLDDTALGTFDELHQGIDLRRLGYLFANPFDSLAGIELRRKQQVESMMQRFDGGARVPASFHPSGVQAVAARVISHRERKRQSILDYN